MQNDAKIWKTHDQIPQYPTDISKPGGSVLWCNMTFHDLPIYFLYLHDPSWQTSWPSNTIRDPLGIRRIPLSRTHVASTWHGQRPRHLKYHEIIWNHLQSYACHIMPLPPTAIYRILQHAFYDKHDLVSKCEHSLWAFSSFRYFAIIFHLAPFAARQHLSIWHRSGGSGGASDAILQNSITTGRNRYQLIRVASCNRLSCSETAGKETSKKSGTIGQMVLGARSRSMSNIFKMFQNFPSSSKLNGCE